MKVGLYSPYFDTYGGGERYILSAAKFFLKEGDRVTVFSKELDKNKIISRFNLNLDGAVFKDYNRFFSTLGLDLFFFLSDGSIPTTLAKHNWIHFQTPFIYANQKTSANKLKLARFEKVICNSDFTKNFIDRTYNVNSIVIYPPVDVDNFKPGKKDNIILSVGRFFAEPHQKKQEVLVEAFTAMVKGGLKGWRLVLFGGIAPDKTQEIENLRSSVKDLPIEIIADGSFDQLQKLYSQGKIFWHAAGFGEDLNAHPDRAEHFGITTVEAMAAGCVPVVFNGGGQREIIREEENGFFWETTDQLIQKTEVLINNRKILENISLNAQERAKFFGEDRFFEELKKICA